MSCLWRSRMKVERMFSYICSRLVMTRELRKARALTVFCSTSILQPLQAFSSLGFAATMICRGTRKWISTPTKKGTIISSSHALALRFIQYLLNPASTGISSLWAMAEFFTRFLGICSLASMWLDSCDLRCFFAEEVNRADKLKYKKPCRKTIDCTAKIQATIQNPAEHLEISDNFDEVELNQISIHSRVQTYFWQHSLTFLSPFYMVLLSLEPGSPFLPLLLCSLLEAAFSFLLFVFMTEISNSLGEGQSLSFLFSVAQHSTIDTVLGLVKLFLLLFSFQLEPSLQVSYSISCLVCFVNTYTSFFSNFCISCVFLHSRTATPWKQTTASLRFLRRESKWQSGQSTLSLMILLRCSSCSCITSFSSVHSSSRALRSGGDFGYWPSISSWLMNLHSNSSASRSSFRDRAKELLGIYLSLALMESATSFFRCSFSRWRRCTCSFSFSFSYSTLMLTLRSWVIFSRFQSQMQQANLLTSPAASNPDVYTGDSSHPVPVQLLAFVRACTDQLLACWVLIAWLL